MFDNVHTLRACASSRKGDNKLYASLLQGCFTKTQMWRKPCVRKGRARAKHKGSYFSWHAWSKEKRNKPDVSDPSELRKAVITGSSSGALLDFLQDRTVSHVY